MAASLERKVRKFIFWSLFFLFIIFLTFLFFHPKFYSNENVEFLEYENLTDAQIEDVTLKYLEPGDIILHKPISYTKKYYYESQENIYLKNKYVFFMYYNLFELLINSMGDGNYWHASIYIGDEKINSLSPKGIAQDNLNEKYFDTYYFTILRLNVNESIKENAIEKTREDSIRKDYFYSFKNGLLIVFFRATGININPHMDEKRLVCSSYIASLYPYVKFQDKVYKYVTPVDLVDEDLTEIVMARNERGFYYE